MERRSPSQLFNGVSLPRGPHHYTPDLRKDYNEIVEIFFRKFSNTRPELIASTFWQQTAVVNL